MKSAGDRFIWLAVLSLLLHGSLCQAESSGEDIRAAMKKATRFMVEKAAYRGGYVWAVSEDFSKRWGELPARPTQIWIQQGTPMVGMVLLDAFEATGDIFYLDGARKAADALIFGQHPLGGWHYFVDFDPKGILDWYRKEASRFKWGYEEYRHYYGNCTFDDGVTADATRFLLRLYAVSLDPAYRAPLLKALDFIVTAQYPNGAWPQRYPLRYEFAHDGLPDYTSYYTLNDGVMRGNIEVLVEAYETLGDERYLDAAKRAVEFLISVQGPEDQAGWAEQYGPDLKPAAARTHEPAGYVIRESVGVIELLQTFYLMTGERRYLKPIPACLDWFDRIKSETGSRPLARYFEPGTNQPIYVIQTDKTNDEGYGLYRLTNDPAEVPGREYRRRMDVDSIRQELNRIAAYSPEKARDEYENRSRARPDYYEWRRAGFEDVLRDMDSRGAWINDRIRVVTVVPDGMNPGTHERVRGISTMTFVANLRVLLDALKAAEDRCEGDVVQR